MLSEKLLTTTLINFSIGTSAVRNQGNGIAEPIRKKLRDEFSIPAFLKSLKHSSDTKFKNYLDSLTYKVSGLKGVSNNDNPAGRVKWGTARKCVNLLFRSIVYNGFVWSEYKIRRKDFDSGGLMDKLELPLDSYSVKGVRKDCKEYDISFDKQYTSFTIISLDRYKESPYYQEQALLIAQKRKICRVDLDIHYWRSQESLA